MESQLLSLDTSNRQMIDLTGPVAEFCSGRGDGLCHVFVPHATAGLALMETGSGSEADLEEMLGRVLVRDDRYRHRHGSPGHGADHLLPALVCPSVVLAVLRGPCPARDVAVGGPRRPERRQPPSPGPVVLPGRRPTVIHPPDMLAPTWKPDPPPGRPSRCRRHCPRPTSPSPATAARCSTPTPATIASCPSCSSGNREDAVVIDADEARAMRMLERAGLVPTLRFAHRAG